MEKKHVLFGVVLAAALSLVAAPAWAVDGTDDKYVGPSQVSVSPAVIGACGEAEVIFQPGYFGPGESVALGATGRNVEAAGLPSSVSARGDGGLVATFRPPAGGEGTYALSFNGAARSYQAVITVSDLPSIIGACSIDPAAADMELALTGGAPQAWALWTGIGALALGGTLVTAGAVRRRRA